MSTEPSANSGLAALLAVQQKLARKTAIAPEAQRAWATLERCGLPTRREEAWSYTGLSALGEAAFALAERPLPSEDMKLRTFERNSGAAAADLVFYNGFFVASLSRLPTNCGVTARVLSVEGAAFEEASDFANGAWFGALNTALAQEVFAIDFAADAQLETPLLLTFLSASAPTGTLGGALGARTISAPRIVVRFARGAQGAFVERFAMLGTGACLSIPSTTIILEEGAQACCARLQNENLNSFHFGTTSARVGRSASLDLLQISLGGRLSRQELDVRLEGEGASAKIDGLALTEGRQHIDSRTAIEHVVGNTSSAQLYKTIAAGESRSVFSGRIRIERHAQKSSTAQLCQSLSLSPRAEIDAKPELEIFADDVKASHGATIGQIDAEQLFYFQTRAIDPAAAEQALARGFAQEVVLRAPPQIREFVAVDVEAKFARLGTVGRDSRAAIK